MGLMNKIKFWKKTDDSLGLEDNLLPPDNNQNMPDHLGLDSPNDNFPEQNTGLDMNAEVDNPASFQEQSQQYPEMQQAPATQNMQPVESDNKDFALISSKLDTIKAELDSMSQRIQKIEKIVEQSDKEQKKPVW